MSDKKIGITPETHSGHNPNISATRLDQASSTDIVKELELGGDLPEDATLTDSERKKKVAAFKKQYASGELKAQPSESVAEKVIKKLGF